jgi:hypothetical protein
VAGAEDFPAGPENDCSDWDIARLRGRIGLDQREADGRFEPRLKGQPSTWSSVCENSSPKPRREAIELSISSG